MHFLPPKLSIQPNSWFAILIIVELQVFCQWVGVIAQTETKKSTSKLQVKICPIQFRRSLHTQKLENLLVGDWVLSSLLSQARMVENDATILEIPYPGRSSNLSHQEKSVLYQLSYYVAAYGSSMLLPLHKNGDIQQSNKYACAPSAYGSDRDGIDFYI